MNKCRVSGTEIIEFLDFGKQPLGNGFINQNQIENEFFFNMRLGFSPKSKMVQLIDQPPAEKMFHDEYAFYSSTSNFMKTHFENFYKEIIGSKYLDTKRSLIVELGCNDGILLKNFSNDGYMHVGIEPSINVAKEANINGVETIEKFFTKDVAREIVKEKGKASAFVAANVMCHISNIREIVEAISILLDDNGVVIFEDPYLGSVIEKNSYDQLYDEHVFLFSAHSIQYLFNEFHMELFDLKSQTTHGGSMRYYLCKKGSRSISPNVEKIIQYEKDLKLDNIETYIEFANRVSNSKQELLSILKKLKSEGKKVAGYAATSKSTTILNYCGIGPDLIEYICDTTPIKHNKISPGMHLPILPYESYKENPPDYFFLFAWNHKQEILQKESEFTNKGGKWITHIPEVCILWQ